MRCDELCGASVTGGFRIKGSSRRYALKRATRLVGPGKAGQVTLRLWSRGMRDLKAALRKNRRVTATLTVSASDAARNTSGGSARVKGIR
jgi:hypothetical protein